MIHSKLDVIILSLGDVCNFQCKYCSQERRFPENIKSNKFSCKLIKSQIGIRQFCKNKNAFIKVFLNWANKNKYTEW